MAKSRKKVVELQSFGGTKELGQTEMLGDKHEVVTAEVQSRRRFEDFDDGGKAAIIRTFTFGMNFQSFTEAKPTKQEIFNAHLKGLEIALWKDGLKMWTAVQPQITFNVEKGQYSIIVGAQPINELVSNAPGLKELVHGA
jgi:hypothetical protein